MDKMGYPRGLIRYSTGNAIANRWDFRRILGRVVRARVLVYSGILAAIVVAAGTTLYLRVPLKVDVIRDRASLAREVEGGAIENVYRLQLMNTEEKVRAVRIAVEGDAAALGGLAVVEGARTVEVPATTTRSVAVRVRAEPRAGRGSQPIEFVVRSADAGGKPIVIREKSRFLIP
jgi:polyferredoxin